MTLVTIVDKAQQAMNALVESNEALMKLNSEKDARIKLLTDQLTSALNIPALNIPATYEEKQAINQTGRTSVRDGHGAGKNIFILWILWILWGSPNPRF